MESLSGQVGATGDKCLLIMLCFRQMQGMVKFITTYQK
jgi:hypothetical protein